MGIKCKPGVVIYQGSVKREDTNQPEYYCKMKKRVSQLKWSVSFDLKAKTKKEPLK